MNSSFHIFGRKLIIVIFVWRLTFSLHDVNGDGCERKVGSSIRGRTRNQWNDRVINHNREGKAETEKNMIAPTKGTQESVKGRLKNCLDGVM